MRIAVIGTGRMGAAIVDEAVRAGHSVPVAIAGADNRDQGALTAARFEAVDVAIEFSRPDVAVANLTRLLELRVPVVTGTTGWYDELPSIEAMVQSVDGAFLYGPNFSIGAALFQASARTLAGLLARHPNFDCAITEAHHRMKRDAPSGTALALQLALRAADQSRTYPITSIRLGGIPGTHALIADARDESIELVHTVRNRAVFAQGAVLAADWLHRRRGFFHFHDLFEGDR